MKIAVIGGGTGLPTILRGIKYFLDIEISAIVTISDDGGSTGKLSHHFKIPAVGDIRRVLGAMSINRELLEEALEHRFENTSSHFDGHSMGNLLILSEILRTKSFTEGITSASKILNIQGKVVPIANHINTIAAELATGEIVVGESNFSKKLTGIRKVFFPNQNTQPNTEAIQDILKADFIILGIGSLYTSIIPNLIYPRIVEALKQTQAKIIYFANVCQEKGETDNMDLLAHIEALEFHTFKNVIDHIIISSSDIPTKIIDKYVASGQPLIVNDLHRRKDLRFSKFDLLTFDEGLIRHDYNKIEKKFMEILKSCDFHPRS